MGKQQADSIDKHVGTRLRVRELVAAFTRITDAELRRRIVALIEELAGPAALIRMLRVRAASSAPRNAPQIQQCALRIGKRRRGASALGWLQPRV